MPRHPRFSPSVQDISGRRLLGPGPPAGDLSRGGLPPARGGHLDGAGRGVPHGGPARGGVPRHAPLRPAAGDAGAARRHRRAGAAAHRRAHRARQRPGGDRRHRRAGGGGRGDPRPRRRGAAARSALAADHRHPPVVPRRAGRRPLLRRRRLPRDGRRAGARAPHRRGPSPSTSTRRATRPGGCIPRSWIEALVDWAAREDLWIIADEVYEDYVFAGEHTYTRPLAPERTFAAHSFSKAYGMAGNRCGYVVGPVEAVRELRKIGMHSFYSTPTAAQIAALRVMGGPGDAWIARAREQYQATGDRAAARLGLPAPRGEHLPVLRRRSRARRERARRLPRALRRPRPLPRSGAELRPVSDPRPPLLHRRAARRDRARRRGARAAARQVAGKQVGRRGRRGPPRR